MRARAWLSGQNVLALLMGAVVGVAMWLWDTPQPRFSLKASSAGFGGSKRFLAVFQCSEGNHTTEAIHLWDLATGSKVTALQLPDPKPALYSLAFSHDETRIAARSMEGTICLWDRESGRELGAYAEVASKLWQNHRYLPVFFGPGDALLVMGPKTTMQGLEFSIWDVATGKEADSLDWNERWIENSLDRNGYLIACGSGVFKTWRLGSCQPGPSFPAKDFDGLQFTITPDGRYLAWLVQESPWLVRIHDSSTGREVVHIHARAHEFDISPDGQVLAVAWYPSGAESWPRKLGRRFGWRPDPQMRVTTLLNVNTKAELAQINCVNPQFSPDGRYLLGEGPHGVFQLWDLPIRKPMHRSFGWAAAASASVWLFCHGIGRLRRRVT